jgi:hypothetical protein
MKKNPPWLRSWNIYNDTVEKWDTYHYGMFDVLSGNELKGIPEEVAEMYDPVNKWDKRRGIYFPTVWELKAEFRHFFRLQRKKRMLRYTNLPDGSKVSMEDKLWQKLWKDGEAKWVFGNTAINKLDDKEWRISASKRRDFRRSIEE